VYLIEQFLRRCHSTSVYTVKPWLRFGFPEALIAADRMAALLRLAKAGVGDIAADTSWFEIRGRVMQMHSVRQPWAVSARIISLVSLLALGGYVTNHSSLERTDVSSASTT